MITVFTPTYNRAYIIRNLYDSLLRQTNKNFEWLVVDDGSTDNTETLINDFIEQQKINIRYIKQKNGGKHRAINRGVKEANGELFFIVDSDDYLTDNAIERIIYYYNLIKEKKEYAGISGMRAFPNGKRIGGNCDFITIDCNAIEIRFIYHIDGDLAEIYITDIIKQYPFPEYENEKFCTEALIWNRIANKYKLLYFNEKIYICEYLQDGLTAKNVTTRINSPKSTSLYYCELSKLNIPLQEKVKAAINYWRFNLYDTTCNIRNKIKRIGYKYIFAMPIGYIVHIFDKKK